jgi:hypothetical protein
MRARSLAGLLVAFAVAWLVLMSLKLAGNATDVPRYLEYGSAVRHGSVPYRDFDVEYPPAALVAFVLPALVGTGARAYRIAFEVLMGLCGIGVLAATAAMLARLGDRIAWRTAFAGAAIVALGPITLGHFDLWPALLSAAALAALLGGRRVVSAVLVGTAVAAKVYAAVLIPLALVYRWRTHGRVDAWRWLATTIASTAAWFVPFLVLAPHGVVDSLKGQADRPLQIESSAAAALLGLKQLVSLPIGVEFSHSSVNLGGTSASAAAAATTIAEALVLLAVWIVFARRPRDSRTLVRAATAATLTFVVLGKVFSPQFLLWLIPMVVLLGGSLSVWAAAGVGLSVLLTRLYFPGRWHALIAFEALPSWLLVARDATLLAVLAFVLRDVLTPSAPPVGEPG